jgi:hypothetical protein
MTRDRLVLGGMDRLLLAMEGLPLGMMLLSLLVVSHLRLEMGEHLLDRKLRAHVFLLGRREPTENRDELLLSRVHTRSSRSSTTYNRGKERVSRRDILSLRLDLVHRRSAQGLSRREK